ncbi:MAG: glycerol-3-phosphate 1-O-acyltransferase PlsY [Candidatus Izemoplasmatales bacterium]|jgi:glycerol-3-phosphate acyltransferase PlsY|nr:glycerol-3-phosphate 1-O-acyltransferase PlsY [bacterium]MDZ4197262.1 glycerol-3-phosphate 1-O-acyltransferase PlsY [Candidatus Izemoplasmatales bacterium]
MEKYLLIVVAYLLGSIPFSYLFGKFFKGIDIRKHGSGNLGGTNAFRVLGKPIGFAVSILDVLKSGIFVFLLLYTSVLDGFDLFHPLIYGFVSVLGHVYPVWFRFKGGKGVATSAGLLLAYNPVLALALTFIFFTTEFLTRYVSVSSTVAMVSGVMFATVLHFTYQADWYLLIISFLSCCIVVYAHRANYRRLRLGTENRVKIFDKWDIWLDRKLNK